jgi:hypothetical protein
MGDHYQGFLWVDCLFEVYNNGLLTEEILDAFLEGLKSGVDVDFGDAGCIETKDGLDMYQVILKYKEPEWFEEMLKKREIMDKYDWGEQIFDTAYDYIPQT